MIDRILSYLTVSILPTQYPCAFHTFNIDYCLLSIKFYVDMHFALQIIKTKITRQDPNQRQYHVIRTSPILVRQCSER
jgi:hypothetical protein